MAFCDVRLQVRWQHPSKNPSTNTFKDTILCPAESSFVPTDPIAGLIHGSSSLYTAKPTLQRCAESMSPPTDRAVTVLTWFSPTIHLLAQPKSWRFHKCWSTIVVKCTKPWWKQNAWLCIARTGAVGHRVSCLRSTFCVACHVTMPSNIWDWRFKPNAPLFINDLPIFVSVYRVALNVAVLAHSCF